MTKTYYLLMAGIALMPMSLQAQEAPQESADPAKLGDIIVTAQRRSENLQNVPVSVTAVNGEQLAEARVLNAENLGNLSPSVTVRTTSNPSTSTNIQIRGIGTAGTGRSFEGAVGVFIDGVYRTRAGQALQTFLDIDNLQILRGPQGTLFGKNTSAGALLMTSKAPALNAFEASGEATYGNYNYYVIRGAVTLPVGDDAAFRVAAVSTKRDGFIKDVNSDRTYQGFNTQAIKAQFLAERGDVTVRLIADYAHDRTSCCFGAVLVQGGPTRAFTDQLILSKGLRVPSKNPDDYEGSSSKPSGQLTEDYGAAALVDWELGPGTLHSVTGLRKYIVDSTEQDADYSAADILSFYQKFDSQFFSQELTYNVKVEPLNADVVVGGFFSDEKIIVTRGNDLGVDAQAFWENRLPAGFAVNARPGHNSDEFYEGRNRSIALFTHWDFALGDKFNVIVGARYSWERKRLNFRYTYYSPDPLELFRRLGSYPGPAYDATQRDKALSGTLAVQFRPVDGVMTYASYNRGFKAGGVALDQNAAGARANNPAETPGGVPLDPRYRPEKIDAYEVGMKLQWLDGRARTNIAGFYNSITDLQVAQFLGLAFQTLNAPKAKTAGIELENQLQISSAVRFDLSASWLPTAKFGEAAELGPILSGRRFAVAPKWTFNTGLNLDTPVSNALALTGRVQVQYTGRVYTATSNNFEEGAMALVNANIGLKTLDDRAQIELWAQNLFDKRYITNHLLTPFQVATDVSGYVGAPRTIGITLRGKF